MGHYPSGSSDDAFVFKTGVVPVREFLTQVWPVAFRHIRYYLRY
jgi:hypothetical protein